MIGAGHHLQEQGEWLELVNTPRDTENASATAVRADLDMLESEATRCVRSRKIYNYISEPLVPAYYNSITNLST